ncbi:hypothetical protein DFJ73DRAFT_846461 [Zopfochytrium polystomum]|nr:hypothetical protein DFJ73DRAFT_846461 [Zopfochytrium polystomum]
MVILGPDDHNDKNNNNASAAARKARSQPLSSSSSSAPPFAKKTTTTAAAPSRAHRHIAASTASTSNARTVAASTCSPSPTGGALTSSPSTARPLMDSRRQPTLTAFFPRSSAKKGSAALAPAQSAAAANGVASAAGPRSGQAKTTVAKLDAATRKRSRDTSPPIERRSPPISVASSSDSSVAVPITSPKAAKGSTSRSGAVSGATSKKAGSSQPPPKRLKAGAATGPGNVAVALKSQAENGPTGANEPQQQEEGGKKPKRTTPRKIAGIVVDLPTRLQDDSETPSPDQPSSLAVSPKGTTGTKAVLSQQQQPSAKKLIQPALSFSVGSSANNKDGVATIAATAPFPVFVRPLATLDSIERQKPPPIAGKNVALDVELSLELLKVFDFLTEFGDELLGIDTDDLGNLVDFELYLHRSNENFMSILAIYKGFLQYLHSRWAIHQDFDVQWGLLRHFDKPILPWQRQSAIDPVLEKPLKALRSGLLTDLTASEHALILSSLVDSVLATTGAHDALDRRLEASDGIRKEIRERNKLIYEIKTGNKALEEEVEKEDEAIRGLEARIRSREWIRREGSDSPPEVPDCSVGQVSGGVTLRVGKETVKSAAASSGGGAAATKSKRRLALETKQQQEESMREVKDELSRRMAERNQIVYKLASAERKLAALTAEEVALRKRLVSEAGRVRAPRLIGWDREGSAYFWVEVQGGLIRKPGGDGDDKRRDDAGDDDLDGGEVTCGILVQNAPDLFCSSLQWDAGDVSSSTSYRFISSYTLLRGFVRSLNDRFLRERHLLAKIQERFLDCGVRLPTAQISRDAAWAKVIPPDEERVLDACLSRFGAWIQARGKPVPGSALEEETATARRRRLQLQNAPLSTRTRSRTTTAATGATSAGSAASASATASTSTSSAAATPPDGWDPTQGYRALMVAAARAKVLEVLGVCGVSGDAGLRRRVASSSHVIELIDTVADAVARGTFSATYTGGADAGARVRQNLCIDSGIPEPGIASGTEPSEVNTGSGDDDVNCHGGGLADASDPWAPFIAALGKVFKELDSARAAAEPSEETVEMASGSGVASKGAGRRQGATYQGHAHGPAQTSLLPPRVAGVRASSRLAAKSGVGSLPTSASVSGASSERDDSSSSKSDSSDDSGESGDGDVKMGGGDRRVVANGLRRPKRRAAAAARRNRNPPPAPSRRAPHRTARSAKPIIEDDSDDESDNSDASKSKCPGKGEAREGAYCSASESSEEGSDDEGEKREAPRRRGPTPSRAGGWEPATRRSNRLGAGAAAQQLERSVETRAGLAAAPSGRSAASQKPVATTAPSRSLRSRAKRRRDSEEEDDNGLEEEAEYE